MILTVQDLLSKLNEFDGSAILQIDYQGFRFHLDEIDKDDLANVVIFMKEDDVDRHTDEDEYNQ